VLFVWHKAGWDLEVEVGTEDISVWGHERRTGETFYGGLDEYRSRLGDLLYALSR
jgi:hypothetical protein